MGKNNSRRPITPKVRGVLIALLLLVRPLCLLADEPCLRIASVAEAPDADFGKALGEALYREAGLCAAVIRLPTERLKRMLDSGEIDGVVVRSREFIAAYPELVAVPTPLLTVEGRLYWRTGQPKPVGEGYKIGIPRGWVWPRVTVQSLGAEPIEVDANESLPRMVEAGRIDGFTMADYEFDTFVASERERSSFSSVSVNTLLLYHTVTRPHADLLPVLDAAVRRLVARGEIKQLLGPHRGL